MVDTTILTQDEVERALKDYNDGADLAACHIPALCQTVRALRAQLDRTNTLGEEMLTRLEALAGIGKRADHGWYYVLEKVEAKLAAVTQERDALWEQVRKLNDEVAKTSWQVE